MIVAQLHAKRAKPVPFHRRTIWFKRNLGSGKYSAPAVVECRTDTPVALLKKLIKDESKPRLDHCSVDELNLSVPDGTRLDEKSKVGDIPAEVEIIVDYPPPS